MAETVTNYKILQDVDSSALGTAILADIRLGWYPWGNLQVVGDTSDPDPVNWVVWYIQPMVFYGGKRA